jgi:hypothetical protein
MSSERRALAALSPNIEAARLDSVGEDKLLQ